MREDIFGYEAPPAGTGALVEWYVNFADRSLFVAYGGPPLAQDEMQVAEHPALGSLREALKASTDPRLAPFTRDDDGPTPVLIRGVERRSAIDTEPDLLAGRTQGLYGNDFARARPEAIRSAVTVLQPPTITSNSPDPSGSSGAPTATIAGSTSGPDGAGGVGGSPVTSSGGACSASPGSSPGAPWLAVLLAVALGAARCRRAPRRDRR